MFGDHLFLVGHFFFWTLVLIIMEAKDSCCKKCCKKKGKEAVDDKIDEMLAKQVDEDVITESQRVNSPESANLQVRVQNLRKEYRAPCGVCRRRSNLVAVEKLSFGLDIGECFALLGVNGARKSTTFKTFMNEVVPTSGTVTVGGYDVHSDFSQVRKMIGYCP